MRVASEGCVLMISGGFPPELEAAMRSQNGTAACGSYPAIAMKMSPR